MTHFKSIKDLSSKIKHELNDGSHKKIITLYAFNATGKTRLTNEIASEKENESLYYSAFLEDIFSWDNENLVFKFNTDSQIIKFIEEDGLEREIANNFKDITWSKIEPSFNFKKGEVTFSFASGDDRSVSGGVKISRGEESIFIWSIFYTVLKSAMEILSENIDDRYTRIFNDLRYIIVDDPVSSLDDDKIINIAIRLIKLIKNYEDNNLRFLITTHHSLFYNVVINSLKRNNKNYKHVSYAFYKNEQDFELIKQGSSPFSYHLQLKDIINEAIDNDILEKYHFNLFRNLLEKTASFLGYNKWSDCVIDNKNKNFFVNALNLYSHSRVVDLESSKVTDEEKILFKNTFNSFLENFKWK